MVYTEIFQECYKIEIGRNELENDQLVKNADQESLWFHLSGQPSPHGILTNIANPGEYTNNAIYRCAELVKSYSKAKNLHRIKLDYLPIANIKPTSKPGLVILKKSAKIIVV